MTRLPVPGGDDGTWGDVLNQFLLTSHDADGSLSSTAVRNALPDGSVTNAKIADGTIAEAKLDAAVQTKLNAGGGDPAVGGDLSGTASNAQIVAGAVGGTELAGGAVTDAKVAAGANIAQSKIQNLTGDLAAKATDSAVVHLAGAETITGAKNFTGGATINGTNIVVTTDSRLSDQRTPVDGTVTDAKVAAGANIAQSKIANLTSDLAAKADKTITVTGATSLTGGGDLTANRTISLVNDAGAPGNSRYYGTDGAGAKGFHPLPAGDPTMGGDLTGTASNAQIAVGAVGATELAADSVTEPKLDAANSPSNGQVLSWNGTNFSWVNQTTVSGYVQGSGIAKITVGTSAPSSPAVGDVWINT